MLSCLLGITRCVPHEIVLFFTKLVCLRQLDIGQIFVLACLWTLTLSWSITLQKITWPISSHLDLTLGEKPICILLEVRIYEHQMKESYPNLGHVFFSKHSICEKSLRGCVDRKNSDMLRTSLETSTFQVVEHKVFKFLFCH